MMETRIIKGKASAAVGSRFCRVAAMIGRNAKMSGMRARRKMSRVAEKDRWISLKPSGLRKVRCHRSERKKAKHSAAMRRKSRMLPARPKRSFWSALFMACTPSSDLAGAMEPAGTALSEAVPHAEDFHAELASGLDDCHRVVLPDVGVAGCRA